MAELKQLVTRPDVVEMHDVTAKDPGLLVHLKSIRNTVPVPRHWCFKRKYLQGKRGIEKPPFDLPEFIKKTGIMEMRAALQVRDHPFKRSACLRGEGVSPMPTFADARGVGVSGMPTSAIWETNFDLKCNNM